MSTPKQVQLDLARKDSLSFDELKYLAGTLNISLIEQGRPRDKQHVASDVARLLARAILIDWSIPEGTDVVVDDPESVSNQESAITTALPSTYFVDSASGNDSNSGLSPISAWKTIGKVNGFAGFVSDDTVRFRTGQIHNGSLNPPRPNMRFDKYGPGDNPIIGHVQNILGAPGDWTDNGGSIPETWTRQITSTLQPSRCAFKTNTGSLGVFEGIGIPRAGAQSNVSIDIRGTTGNWTQVGTPAGLLSTVPNLWQRTVPGFSSDRVHFAISFNGGVPVGTKLSDLELAVNNDFRGSVDAGSLLVFQSGGNPATVYSTIRVSAMWHSSTVSGSTRLITVFSPSGNPATAFKEILIGGNCASGTESIQLSTIGHKFKNIRFMGSDNGLDPNVGVGDCDFDGCDFSLQNTRGIRINDNCHRIRIENFKVDGNGLVLQQGHFGVKIGDANSGPCQDIVLKNGRIWFSGEDGFTAQLTPDSGVWLYGVDIMGSSENEMDLKSRAYIRMENCSLKTLTIFAQGAGTGPGTVQTRCKVFARNSSFIVSNGALAPGNGGGPSVLQWNARTEGHMDNCVITGTDTSMLRHPGDSTGYGPIDEEFGAWKYRGCLIVDTAAGSTARSAVRHGGGRVEISNSTIVLRGATTSGRTVNITPGNGGGGAGTANTKMTTLLRGCILQSDGGGVTAELIDRNVTAGVTGVGTFADDCLWWQKANPTNWVRGDAAPTNYTESQIDAGITLGTPECFRIFHTKTDDPTADPMFDNEWEGGPMPGYPTFHVGNYRLGGDVYLLEFSSAPATPWYHGARVAGSVSGATGYVRNFFNTGGISRYILSSVAGTFQNNEVITDQFGTVLGTLASSNAFVGPLKLRTLVWSAQTVNFSTLGQVVTGGNSGHTGYLLSQQDAGSTGRAVIACTSTSTFENNETVTGAVDGSITLTGVARESPAKQRTRLWMPNTFLGAPDPGPANMTSPISKGREMAYFETVGSGTDRLTVVAAARTWTRADGQVWSSTLVGQKFKTNRLGSSLDGGGPYTVESVAGAALTTVEVPPAEVTADTDWEMYMYAFQDAGCYQAV